MEDLLLSDSVQKVHKVLNEQQVAHEFRVLSDSTRTAQMAADVLGCTPSEIASSLIFEAVDTGELVLIVASGGHRVDLDYVCPSNWASLCKWPKANASSKKWVLP